jgi:hypothetical protein
MKYLNLFESLSKIKSIKNTIYQIHDICESLEDEYKGSYKSYILFFLCDGNTHPIKNPSSDLIRNNGKNTTWFSLRKKEIYIRGSNNWELEGIYYNENEDPKGNFQKSIELSKKLKIDFKSITIQIVILEDPDNIFNDPTKKEILECGQMVNNLIKHLQQQLEFFKFDNFEDDPRGFFMQCSLEDL